MIKEIEKNLVRGSNQLRRILQEEELKKVKSIRGSLLNGNRLSEGYSLMEAGLEDPYLFKVSKNQPVVKAAFSFACDHSDSLNWSGTPISYWTQLVYLLGGLHKMAHRAGIEASSCLVRQRYDWKLDSSSTSAVPTIHRVLNGGEPWKDRYYKTLLKYKPNGGTSTICYAESALKLASELDSKIKVAFFLTDGDCYEKEYLESLRQQAEAKGIHLVGIGLGVKSKGLPNGISGRDAVEVSQQVISTLVKVIKTR